MSEVRMIKKYPNRRLYDCLESRYIRLEDLRQLVVDGIDFKVFECGTEQDITSSTLLQVVAHQEQGPEGLLGKGFLVQLIRAYRSSTALNVRGYLDESLRLFVGEQPVAATGDHPAVAQGGTARGIS